VLKSWNMSNQKTTSSNTLMVRVLLALSLPLLAAVITAYVLNTNANIEAASSQGVTAILMSAVAIVSWIMGLRWYGLQGLGLRGGRPLTSGIGFAALAWILFIILRFIFVGIDIAYPQNSTRSFIYILLFEAFATQLWSFGLMFRSIADWRGPLTAAFASGILFGLIGTLLFQENFFDSRMSIIYFVCWGVLYGFIRLRTGSILGIVIVQALQSFTAWVVIATGDQIVPGQAQNLYVAASIVYIIIIWRLWPRREKDYRV